MLRNMAHILTFRYFTFFASTKRMTEDNKMPSFLTNKIYRKMKKEEKMTIAERMAIKEREQMERQAKESRKMKREARKNKVFHIAECSDGCHIIKIHGLNSSEASLLIQKMTRQMGLSAKKDKDDSNAA